MRQIYLILAIIIAAVLTAGIVSSRNDTKNETTVQIEQNSNITFEKSSMWAAGPTFIKTSLVGVKYIKFYTEKGDWVGNQEFCAGKPYSSKDGYLFILCDKNWKDLTGLNILQ